MDDPPGGPATPEEANTYRSISWNLREGLSGLCYARRRALVANLQDFAAEFLEGQTFKMAREHQNLVRKDRRWLLSVPVSDPEASSPGRLPLGCD